MDIPLFALFFGITALTLITGLGQSHSLVPFPFSVSQTAQTAP